MERDPIRWKDDPEIERALREDLREVMDMPAPSIDVAAGLSRLEKTIEGGGGGGGLGGLGAGPWIAGAIIVVSVAGALLWRWTREPSVVEAPVAVSAHAPERREDPIAPPSAPARVVEDEEAPPIKIATPRPRVRERTRPSAPVEVPAAIAAPAEAACPDGALAETELLGRARLAANRRDHARALALAEEGERCFPAPRGQFHEERRAIAVLSLSALGRSEEARRRGERFLRLYPNGTQSERVRRALGEVP